MLHNPRRLQRIEIWSRWLAWIYLAVFIKSVISLFIQIETDNFFPYVYSFYGPPTRLGFWDSAPEVVHSVFPILVSLGGFLLLMGISKAVRFLRTYYVQITAED